MDTVTNLDFNLGFNNGIPGGHNAKPRAKFFLSFMFDPQKSTEQNRPIFKSVTLLQVDTSDNTTRDIKTVVPNEMHKKTFAPEWETYTKFINPFLKTGLTDDYSFTELKDRFPEIAETYISNLKNLGISGELIEEAGYIPQSKAIELKYLGIFTTEQLINYHADDHVSHDLIDAAIKHKEAKDNLQNVSELIKTCRELTKKLNNN